ncbi:MAG: rhodanese-like domain-containing protein [Thermodesulfobacteriota bacterium]
MRTLYQIIGIFILVGIAGFGSNMMRSEPLLVRGSPHLEAEASASEINTLRISLEQARELYNADQAIFIDARPEPAYRTGHIKDAINLPWQRAEEECFRVLEQIPMDRPIVTYCDGKTCDLSEHLARFFQDLGYTKARSLHNGLSRWQKKGLPLADAKG